MVKHSQTALDTRRLLERAAEAAGRWENREAARTARQTAIEKGDYLAAESPDRLAQRVNRLMGEARRTAAYRSPPAEALAEMMARPVITAAELDDALVKEAIVNASAFLSVEFFERGLAAARAVGRVVGRSASGLNPRGTGFLVGPGVLLTNEHVLPTAEIAASSAVEMDFEENQYGPLKRSQVFPLRPDQLFVADKNLDLALVAVEPTSVSGEPLAPYGWLPLDASQGKISFVPEDMLNIIQHPLGRPKEVVIRNNNVLDLRTEAADKDDGLGPFIHYEGGTQKGSSGSPVLNDQWEVVALHHSGVPARDAKGRILDRDEKVWNRDAQSIDVIKWIANEGVRVSSIVAFIEGAKFQPHEREFVDILLSGQAPGRFGAQTVSQEGLDEEDFLEPLAASVARLTAAGGRPRKLFLEVPLRFAVSFGDVRVSDQEADVGDAARLEISRRARSIKRENGR